MRIDYLSYLATNFIYSEKKFKRFNSKLNIFLLTNGGILDRLKKNLFKIMAKKANTKKKVVKQKDTGELNPTYVLIAVLVGVVSAILSAIKIYLKAQSH